MQINRKITKVINVGNVKVGEGSPISIQSMTKTLTSNVKKTIEQIDKLTDAGADIIRVSVNDIDAVNSITEIVSHSRVPIVADIHYNHHFALRAIEAGVSKIRINPGNIGSEENIKKVLMAANLKNIPIRIGVNSGSLEKDILAKYQHPTPEALLESAIRHIKIANKYEFDNLIIAIKSSSVFDTINAYKMLSNETDYPLHLGLTEAGSEFGGLIKSTTAISHLLLEGIGDTIRFSLNADPVKEIYAAKDLLKSLNLIEDGIEIISCPRCGRSKLDTSPIILELEARVRNIKGKNIKVAIMACPVNGIGEAQSADIAVTLAEKKAMLYIGGEYQREVLIDNIFDTILNEIENYKS
jgi:(E)-4-hydroxy-3-methylbut-2-enyl-diphosphate synthase